MTGDGWALPAKSPFARRVTGAVALLGAVVGCAAHQASPLPPPVPVVAAPPPRDDGKPSDHGTGGVAHSAALEELLTGPLLPMGDKQRSLRLPVPDARHWTRVKFFGLPSLLGLRYGKDHHAVIGVTVQHVDPAAPLSACGAAFEAWGAPLLDAFDVDVVRDPPVTFAWQKEKAELHASYARTASLVARDGFAVAYGVFPAWPGACLVVGIAVPARDDAVRARAVRDRFAKEVLPGVVVLAKEEPKGRE